METTQHSVIFRHQLDQKVGVQAVCYDRNAIGYVEQGIKHIHLVDRYITVHAGEMFHLSCGTHYVEDRPDPADGGLPFLQTLFFYTPADLRGRFTPPETVGQYFRMCEQCPNRTGVHTFPAWPMLRDFFHGVRQYIETQIHLSNPELGHLKLCELIYLLFSHPSCCVSHPISIALSERRDDFHSIIHQNVFEDLGLPQLAKLCGMSLSMFKNEFRRCFHSSPHRWLTERRLAHGRLQLVTSGRSIAEIADECRFNNASHFIKLFKERYRVTPAVYRRTYSRE